MVDPVIGHIKSDGRLARNFLRGSGSEAMNVLLCAAGHNLRNDLRNGGYFLLPYTPHTALVVEGADAAIIENLPHPLLNLNTEESQKPRCNEKLGFHGRPFSNLKQGARSPPEPCRKIHRETSFVARHSDSVTVLLGCHP